MTTTKSPPCHTFVYKSVLGVDYHLDCYLPERAQLDKHERKTAPILLYWHGGGLCAGTRAWDDLVPAWLFVPALEAGIAVISLEYTLLGPQSAHCILDDIRNAFNFIHTKLNDALPAGSARVDPARIAVSGSSAGGYVAYVAAAALPDQIKAVVSLYGAGADLLSDWYLSEKTAPFLDGLPLLTDPKPFRAILDKPVSSTPPTVSYPVSNPLDPRNLLLIYFLQTGTLLDTLSGTEGASAALRQCPASDRARLVRENSEHVATVLPQLWVTDKFPPCMLLHGTADTLVKLSESRALKQQLENAGVEVKLHEIEGAGHGFDAVGNWENSPAGKDKELTRRKDEALASVLPWSLEKLR
ncbi:hypothetical protein JCM10908_001510 [Rhodotorula pacifica]|uniref:alpha/beta hydrolase n=1 Tax=Rhodotorula pacifica TaxID=1495444 RepID=UPI003171EC21